MSSFANPFYWICMAVWQWYRGPLVYHMFDLPELFPRQVGGKAMPIPWSIIGGALFVAVLRLLSGRSGR